MKHRDGLLQRTGPFFLSLLLVLGVVGILPAVAGDTLEIADPEKIKDHLFGSQGFDISQFGDLEFLATPMAHLHVPIQIVNLPSAWRDGDLVVDGAAIFLAEETVQPIGVCVGRTVEPQALSTGSYQGTVMVEANKGSLNLGGVSNDYRVLAAALVRKGDECMVLGLGCAGDWCSNLPPDTLKGAVGPCGENVLGPNSWVWQVLLSPSLQLEP